MMNDMDENVVRTWIDILLEPDFQDKKIIVDQIRNSEIHIKEEYTDACFWKFRTDKKLAAFPHKCYVPITMIIQRANGIPIEFLLFVKDGFVDEFGIVDYDFEYLDSEHFDFSNRFYMINSNIELAEARNSFHEYSKPAKYSKVVYSDLIISTLDGEKICRSCISRIYDKDELFSVDDPEDVDPKKVRVWLKYDDKEYWGNGTDYTGIDAYADLQNQLPEGVTLKCCLSCRHGSMCPFGNQPNELFCLKESKVGSKAELSELSFWTSEEEKHKRSRHYTDACEDWEAQSGDYFTYTDFPLYLRS